jgi:hypothetical protein
VGTQSGMRFALFSLCLLASHIASGDQSSVVPLAHYRESGIAAAVGAGLGADAAAAVGTARAAAYPVSIPVVVDGAELVFEAGLDVVRSGMLAQRAAEFCARHRIDEHSGCAASLAAAAASALGGAQGALDTSPAVPPAKVGADSAAHAHERTELEQPPPMPLGADSPPAGPVNDAADGSAAWPVLPSHTVAAAGAALARPAAPPSTVSIPVVVDGAELVFEADLDAVRSGLLSQRAAAFCARHRIDEHNSGCAGALAAAAAAAVSRAEATPGAASPASGSRPVCGAQARECVDVIDGESLGGRRSFFLHDHAFSLANPSTFRPRQTGANSVATR